MTLTNDNKTAYLRFIEETFNEGRLDRLNEFVTPGFVAHDGQPGMPPGQAAVEQVVTMFRSAFPDLHVTVDEIVAERDLVSLRTTLRGTHRGALFGIPPTGRSVTMRTMEMVRMKDGRLAESWVCSDVPSLMSQLGAVPSQA
jgi:steroid delta-isomerase-like uncharacterized protein